MTDGGSRNNPGLAAVGFIVFGEDGKILHQDGKAVGVATNNVAEYKALIEALKWLSKNNNSFPVADRIVFRSDSELMVKQLTGEYRIKDVKLKPLAIEAQTLLRQLDLNYSFELIPREQNALADKLVNDALDGIIGH